MLYENSTGVLTAMRICTMRVVDALGPLYKQKKEQS